MNNLLTHYPINWIDGMKLSSRTHSYCSRHELQARASGGVSHTGDYGSNGSNGSNGSSGMGESAGGKGNFEL